MVIVEMSLDDLLPTWTVLTTELTATMYSQNDRYLCVRAGI